MTTNTETLPEPVKAVCVMVSHVGSTHMTPKGNYFTADQMHAHAAKLCADRDAEIERLRGIVPEVLESLNDQLCEENDTLRTAAQQALDALRFLSRQSYGDDEGTTKYAVAPAVAALTAALESKPNPAA